MDFWERCQALMHDREINQSDIGRKLNIGDTTVSYWIRNKSVPRADDALRLADLLGVSVRYLVTGEDDKMLSHRERELLQICSILSEEKFKAVKDIAEIMRKETDRELSGGLFSVDSVKKIK
jgi:transcriptional regulator with XRE-family HTH domain